jgi:hypothetical protein
LGYWQATCSYDLYDPGHHTNEGPFREASGAIADDNFIDGLHYEVFRKQYNKWRIKIKSQREKIENGSGMFL